MASHFGSVPADIWSQSMSCYVSAFHQLMLEKISREFNVRKEISVCRKTEKALSVSDVGLSCDSTILKGRSTLFVSSSPVYIFSQWQGRFLFKDTKHTFSAFGGGQSAWEQMTTKTRFHWMKSQNKRSHTCCHHQGCLDISKRWSSQNQHKHMHKGTSSRPRVVCTTIAGFQSCFS